jgi:hypothetical protein
VDVKQQTMKKIVLAGFVAFLAFTAGAQTFKKGETIEINKELSDNSSSSWSKADIVEVDIENRLYSVKTPDKKLYRIPFSKEDNWIRRPMQPLTTSMRSEDGAIVFSPSTDLLKQKIKEQFDSDFSEYDSVVIIFDNIETLASYKNTGDDLVKSESNVYPFKVDFTVRLVNKNSDGSQKKINWQFKRKYLLYQNQRGKCSISIADKEEQFLSHI